MISLFNRQRGEVSLFIVIFTTLLLTIVTVSFVRIMVQDQQQASTIDLSQSAYDSAQAGVEDAKRAILRYQYLCSQPGADPTDVTNACGLAQSQLDNKTCNASINGLKDLDSSKGPNQQVSVQNGSNSNVLDQAYTCTTVILNTENYEGKLANGAYEIIPLLVKKGAKFDSVTISWFTQDDYNQDDTPTLINTKSLLSAWPQARPPIIRAQLVQFSGNTGFLLNNFDMFVSGKSNANTLFLYPSNIGSVTPDFSANDSRSNGSPGSPSPGSPFSVHCDLYELDSGGFACSAKISLPEPIGGSADDRVAFLRLGSLYNAATYSVTLDNGSEIVNFNGVQPEIDSTGRANDLFRRVRARVKLSSDFAYPSAEIYTSGNFCKNFSVIDVTPTTTSCTP